MKKLYGQAIYVQSVGVRSDREVDGFSVAVCDEIGVAIDRHQTRSFDEMEDWGDDLSGFDLIIAMSPASLRRAQELTRYYHLDVEYWPVLDPTGLAETRDGKLAAYRQTRDQIVNRLIERFGPPVEDHQQDKGERHGT